MNRYGRMGGRMGYFGQQPPNAAGGNMPMSGAPGVAPGAGVGMATLPEDQYGAFHKNVKFWFTYQTPNIAALAASGTTTNSITFDNDSAFEWTKITVQADETNAEQTASTLLIPFVTIQIQDTGQGAYYSNAAIPVEAYMGQLGLPYVMPAPQIIAPNATLQFNWGSYSTSGGGNKTYNNLRLQLHGWKIRR